MNIDELLNQGERRGFAPMVELTAESDKGIVGVYQGMRPVDMHDEKSGETKQSWLASMVLEETTCPVDRDVKAGEVVEFWASGQLKWFLDKEAPGSRLFILFKGKQPKEGFPSGVNQFEVVLLKAKP